MTWCEEVAARAASGDLDARVLAVDLPRELRGFGSERRLAVLSQLGTLVDGCGQPVNDLEMDIPTAARAVHGLVTTLPEDTAAVVVWHAVRRSRPVLLEDADLAPRLVEDTDAPAELDARRRRVLCWLKPDPDRYSVAEVEAARAAWRVWWCALNWLEAEAMDVVEGWRMRPWPAPEAPWRAKGA